MCVCACVCVCVCVCVSVSDGHMQDQDLTADWQMELQHSSRQPQRTLSGCQREFIQNSGVIRGLNFTFHYVNSHL